MSETVARQRPPVDLEAFERRVRQSQRSGHEDDPLAELARIVGDEHDPYGDVFAQQPAPTQADLRASFAPHGRREPSFGSDGGAAPRLADFAAIEAGLRAASPHPQVMPGHDPQPDYAEPDYSFPPEPQGAGDYAGTHDAMHEAAWAEPTRAPAKRTLGSRPALTVAASIAVAVVGIGVAFAYKGTGSSPREIKTIMAAAGPTKVQPPMDAKADAADQDDATLGQGQAPTKLVSREEQPVDLQQAVQDNRDAAGRGTDASSVPVPPGQAGTMSPDYSASGGQTPDAAGASSPSYSDQGFGVGMPLPKKVRSVSVKPDGTIVPGGQDDTASAPAAKPDDRIGELAQDSTPAAAPAPKPPRSSKAAKSTSRVAAVAPPPADAGDDVAVAPAPKPAKPAHKAKPVQVAKAETGTEPAAGNDTADAADDAKPAGSGAWAVQLAAPASESDARSATTKLIKKYSSALHGRRLGFHRADSNGHTVYRVRVSSLTKEDASSLCGKLKADGGSCFVAKN